MSTPFEDQVSAALRQRSSGVAVPEDGRAAIDDRIGERARARRTRRGAVALGVLLLLVVGVVAVVRGGHDAARVVTVPGVPAVHLPQLGLAPTDGTNRIGAWSPGRRSVVFLQPTTSAGSYPAGAVLTETVTDDSLGLVAASTGRRTGGVTTDLGGRQAVTYPEATAPDHGGQMDPAVFWSPVPHVVAELEILRPAGSDIAFSLPATVAASLVEIDDATWWTLLNPYGSPRVGVLALVGPAGHSEISSYQAADPSGGGGSNLQVLDVAGYRPGTFELTTYFFGTPDAPGPPLTPSGSSGSTPRSTPDTEGPDSIDVRGTRAEVLVPPPDVEVPDGFRSQLIWNQGRVQYRLIFDYTVSPQDAAQVAERLSAPTAQEWHALLFPSTLRIDLVPLPDPQPSDGTDTTGG